MSAFQRPFVAVGQAGLQIMEKSKDEGCKSRFGRPVALMAAAAKVAKDAAGAASIGVAAAQGLRQENMPKVRVKNTFIELEEEEVVEEQFKRRDRTHKTDSAAVWALRCQEVADDQDDGGSQGIDSYGNDSDSEANLPWMTAVADDAADAQILAKSLRPSAHEKACSDPRYRSDSSESLGDEQIVSAKSEPAFSCLAAHQHSDSVDDDLVVPVKSDPVPSFARARQHSGLRSFCAEIASTIQSQGASTDTTVMLRNLPNNYTRALLLELIESFGLAGTFDFVYMPCDFESRAGLGYAFVNFVSHADAEKLRLNLNGFRQWCVPSSKVCSVGWSRPCQGLEANIKRYRNSSVMHESVTDEFRPALFVNGQRVPFPPPTKNVKHPNTGNSARFKCRS